MPVHVGREAVTDGGRGGVHLRLGEGVIRGLEDHSIRQALAVAIEWSSTVDVEQRGRDKERAAVPDDRGVDVASRQGLRHDDGQVTLP